MLEIRKIGVDKIDDIIGFLAEIATWLNETGKPMWSLERLKRETFIKSTAESECYLAYLNDEPVASIILAENNEFMWPNVAANETIFVGKLGVARNHSGKGYAKQMLDFAKEEAKKRDKKYLRLDCYADREYLRNLYEGYGFQLVETREMMQGLFAALYEMKI